MKLEIQIPIGAVTMGAFYAHREQLIQTLKTRSSGVGQSKRLGRDRLPWSIGMMELFIERQALPLWGEIKAWSFGL